LKTFFILLFFVGFSYEHKIKSDFLI